MATILQLYDARAMCPVHRTVHAKGELCTPRRQSFKCEFCEGWVGGEPEETLEHLISCENGDTNLDRNAAIKRIRQALRKRSGKDWSVTGGRGTAWGWIRISAPPRRILNYSMTEEDQNELARLLSLSRSRDSVSVPASSDYYAEFVARAEGREPTMYGKQYWD